VHSRRRPLFAFCAIVLIGAAPHVFAEEIAGEAANSHSLATRGGSTTWHLNESVLESLGLHTRQVKQNLLRPHSAKHGSYRALEFAALDLGAFRFRESAGLARALTGGSLQHAGGFVLEFPGGRADLRGFVLKPNPGAPFALDIIGGDDHVWFTLDRGHYQLADANHTLAMRYMNLRLSAYFAQQLKRPEFAGLAVGGVDSVSPLPTAQAALIEAAVCSAPWPSLSGTPADLHMVYQSQDAESGTPDAIHFRRCGLADAGGAYHDDACTQTSTNHGVVFSPDTSLLNGGTTAISWHEMFAHPPAGTGYPPYGNDQHPFLVWNLYRIDADGALRMLAASGVKHAFNTINKTCGCSDHTNNYPTCEDSYSQYSNDIDAQTTPNFLGPRDELIPAQGKWGRCESVFDKNCDANQDADAGAQDDFQYRLIVPENEISAAAQPGAQFLFEYWYVVRDQANIYDAMGFRPLSFSKIPGNGAAYIWQANILTFPNNSTFASGAVINYWVEPAAPPPGALNTEIKTSEGRARIAVRTTALGGDAYRYDYVVMNFDFARALIDPAHASEPNLHVLSSDGFSAFTVPVSISAVISNFTFNDADADASNDWIYTRDASGVHWQAPASHPLNWGTLYRFSFTADRAPLPVDARLDVATAGSPGAYSGVTLAPLDDDIFQDGFE
jgi:hypothetical protein